LGAPFPSLAKRQGSGNNILKSLQVDVSIPLQISSLMPDANSYEEQLRFEVGVLK
jgi:hypothetical protein